MKITGKTKVRCGKCGIKSRASEWNRLTVSKCTTAEMRELYTPINHEQALNQDDKKYYLCPRCLSWSAGCDLIVPGMKSNKTEGENKEAIDNE